jgi:predicted transcriptional regulator
MQTKNPWALVIDSSQDTKLVRALASGVRIRILELLQNQELNVSEIARRLAIPQSTAATSILQLEEAGLLESHTANGVKGGQKVCTARYKEFIITFPAPAVPENNKIEVEMPVGLYTACEISAPCGLCSRDGIIGYLDVPGTFLSPDRIKAALLWFEKGYVEYKFPNNALYVNEKKLMDRLELSMEISSEVPGTDKKWPSDITVWINDVELGIWTSPGDFGDRRGRFTPSFWKLEGSQYGLLSNWTVNAHGCFIDGAAVSNVKLEDLRLREHHSIKVRIGVKENADHMGGINIFGKGFGNYDQDILLCLFFKEDQQ